MSYVRLVRSPIQWCLAIHLTLGVGYEVEGTASLEDETIKRGTSIITIVSVPLTESQKALIIAKH